MNKGRKKNIKREDDNDIESDDLDIGNSEDDSAEDLQDSADLSKDDVRSVALWSTDWTIETIVNQIHKGNIDLNPDFQRRDAWRIQKKSEFIESAILQLPIPQIILAEVKSQRGKFLVIDGKQRLLTLAQFVGTDEKYRNDRFTKFSKLSILRDLSSVNFHEFQSNPKYHEYKTEFENSTIRAIIIRQWRNTSFLYQVFLRTNTGSVKLSPQELRQALKPGNFSTWLEKSAGENETLRDVLRTRGPDFRMRDVELLLRFLAFDSYLSEYGGNLKLFLDDCCEKFNSNFSEKKVSERVAALDRAHRYTGIVFEGNAYSKWDGARYERRFNRAIFDAMTYVFKHESIIESDVESNKNSLEQEFKKLCSKDSDFLASVERTTKTPKSVSVRLKKWAHVVAEILNVTIKVPVIGR